MSPNKIFKWSSDIDDLRLLRSIYGTAQGCNLGDYIIYYVVKKSQFIGGIYATKKNCVINEVTESPTVFINLETNLLKFLKTVYNEI